MALPVNVSVLLTTFGVIFLAELGDKTQLAAMALATRYAWRKAFIGIAAAFALLNVLAVGVGKVLFELVPLGYIKAASALLFLVFGVLTLRSAGEEEEAPGGPRRERGPIATAFALIFLAELGDKTQLVTASLAAQHASPVAVFTGSTLALWLVSLLGLLVGAQLVRVVPLSRVRQAAGALFLVFGAVMAWQALQALRA